MAVRGVDHDHIDFGIHQRLGAGKAGIAHGGRRRHPQAAGRVLGGVRIIHRLLDILDGDEADAMEGIIHHQQLLDPAGVEQTARLFLTGAERHGGEVLGRHQLAHRLERVFGKAHVAVGENADQLAACVDHRNAADAVLQHQRLRFAQRRIGVDRDRVDHHAALVTLHRPHRRALGVDIEIAVEHADAAQLRHRNRHVRLGHGIHCRGQDRDIECNVAGQAGRGVRHARQDAAFRRAEQHIVKGQAERDIHERHFHILA